VFRLVIVGKIGLLGVIKDLYIIHEKILKLYEKKPRA